MADKRFSELLNMPIDLAEQQEGVSQPRYITAVFAVGDKVNGNGRRYPSPVLREAIANASDHLRESLGQGRLGEYVLGEAEHPSGRARWIDTIVKWEQLWFDEADKMAKARGQLIPTKPNGENALLLMESGVFPGVSLRGYGKSETTKENGRLVEEVSTLKLTGIDLLVEQSFAEAGVTLLEQREEFVMERDELLRLLQENQELFGVQLVEQVKQANEKQLAAFEEQVRTTLGVAATDNVAEVLKNARAAQAELTRVKRERAVAEAIEAHTKELPYGDDLNAKFVEAIMKSGVQDAEAIKPLVEAKRVEYDAIVAAAQVEARGFKSGVTVTGPVFERETGVPDFARAAYLFTEQLAVRGEATQRNWKEPKGKSQLFAKQYLEAFDKAYKRQLLEEQRQWQQFQEAEQTSDLNLPYSISRAIVMEAVPELVAASVFDFGLADTSPTRVYYESYSAETGATATITDETFTADHDTWVALAHKRVQPGTLTVELGGTSTAKTQWTDYVVDYTEGKVMILSTGSISDAADLDITYTYDSVREGEMSAIQRGKGALSYETIELYADRLAAEISSEAVTFASSQLSWDATSRTIGMLIREIREMIDKGIMYAALAQAHIAANTGGTWTDGTDALSVLVEKIGTAKVAVQNDNYEPRFVLMSLTSANKLENYFIGRDASMGNIAANRGVMGAGDTGMRVKGLPVFASKHMPDTKVLVHHPEVVQQRVLSTRPMTLKGPYPSYSSNKLVASEQYYVEEYNQTVVLTNNRNKAGYVTLA